MAQYVIGLGNLNTGYRFHGPFKSTKDLEKWVRTHNIKDGEVIRLFDPEYLASYVKLIATDINKKEKE